MRSWRPFPGNVAAEGDPFADWHHGQHAEGTLNPLDGVGGLEPSKGGSAEATE